MITNNFLNLNNAEGKTLNPVGKPIGMGLRGGVVTDSGAQGINRHSQGRASGAQPVNSSGASFADELKKAQSEVKFSKHAETRLKMRNIDLSGEQREKLSLAIDRAGEKGLRDTLVIMDRLALVANVKNRTIVTAVDSGELKQNVFTNIDGAVFA